MCLFEAHSIGNGDQMSGIPFTGKKQRDRPGEAL
ncbi:UNVERIFIED_CONTAM: hypothetical protein GTU68_054021 [Idotea baltica]|nr:hypothetical protein [Idotea baltica]